MLTATSKTDETSQVKVNFANKQYLLTTGHENKATKDDLILVQKFEEQFYQGLFEGHPGIKNQLCSKRKTKVLTHQCQWCMQKEENGTSTSTSKEDKEKSDKTIKSNDKT